MAEKQWHLMAIAGLQINGSSEGRKISHLMELLQSTAHRHYDGER